MEINTTVKETAPEVADESASTAVDQRDAKIARLAAAWDRALGELFAERAAA